MDKGLTTFINIFFPPLPPKQLFTRTQIKKIHEKRKKTL